MKESDPGQALRTLLADAVREERRVEVASR